jgi:uncharacterized repeat protein (TIGR01451 family)
MKHYKQFIATVILSCCITQVQAQEISFTVLPSAATPGLGELVYDTTSDRLYIASGGNTVKVVDTSGTPDINFGGGDGILGNNAEEPLLDAEYLAVSGNRIFISDQERGVVLVVNATSGALDTSLATDGIIGNDPTEPNFTGLTLHDIEILDDQLYIATNSNVIVYALDGSDTNSQFSAFPAQTLTIGPLTNTGNCSNNAIFNNQLLYAIAPNELNSFQGTVACLNNTGAAQTLAQTGDISITDLTFAAAAGDTCGTQTRFSNGNIAYMASRRFDTEIQCIGGDGARAIFNDMTIGASTGIASANDRLYVREVGTIGNIYQSEVLNNSPTVTAQALTIDENTSSPVLITTVIGNDLDPGATLDNWIIQSGNVSLDGDGDLPFSINSASGEISINDVGDLDRELTDKFDLMVTVSDGISTSSPALITINLNDVNEFSPEIDNVAPLLINENLASMQPIVTLTGSDGDATDSLQDWVIVSGNVSVDGDADLPFAINSTSGLISVNDAGDIDRELVAIYNLVVQVSDGTLTSQTSSFSISINDINEFTPTVSNQTLSIDEDKAANTSVTTVIGGDLDATAVLQNWMIVSGNISIDGDGTLPFAINQSGLITLIDTGDIDRELTSSYLLMVTVSDGVNTSMPASIQIDINDINESTPIINSIAPISIDENSLANTSIVTATAVDDDATSTLQDWSIVAGNLSLDGDGDLAFAINPLSGEIQVNDAGDIDRELTADFVLSLSVSDGNTTSEIVNVTISLNDINEFDPIIDSVSALFVNEDDANTTPIVTLTATDEDATTSIQDWMIVSGNTDLDQDGTPPFSIDLATGIITLIDNGDLDSQQIATFVLNVTVSDGSKTSALTPINIQLAPVPSLVTASNDNYQITEGQSIMIPAGGVLNNDEDENGEDLTVDEVNGSNGVSLNTTLDLNLVVNLSSDGSLLIDATQVTSIAEGQSRVVIFSYRATNGSENDIATVSITVQGINHTPLAQDDLFNSFEDEILSANIMDDNGLGIDDDPDQNQNIFIDNPNAITLTGIGGVILVNSDGSFTYTPPADTFGTAMFDYTLSDGAITSTATVVIDVTAINDKPIFTAGSNQFLLSGTTGMQTIPMWATAISAGPNENLQNLSFSVTSTADPDSIVSSISISQNGILEYTLTANQGLARFEVLLMDDGGTDDGGINISTPHELIISNQDGVNIVTLVTDNRITVEDGELLTYEITISNEGPQDAMSANVNNSYSSELINVSWTCTAVTGASCSANGTNNIIDSIDLNVGSHVTYILTATVDGTSGIIENTVTAIPALIMDELFYEDNVKTDLTIIGEEVFKDGFE